MLKLPAQEAESAAIELRETPSGGPAYRAKYDELMQQEVPKALAKQREERRLFEMQKQVWAKASL